MPKNDPIRTVKAFLQAQPPVPAGSSVTPEIARDLREIRERLDRARRVDDRVSPSEILGALLSGEASSA